MLGVVVLHVPAAAAAGGVDGGFHGGGDEVGGFGGGVDGGADVAESAAAVRGFGVGGGDEEVVGHFCMCGGENGWVGGGDGVGEEGEVESETLVDFFPPFI